MTTPNESSSPPLDTPLALARPPAAWRELRTDLASLSPERPSAAEVAEALFAAIAAQPLLARLGPLPE